MIAGEGKVFIVNDDDRLARDIEIRLLLEGYESITALDKLTALQQVPILKELGVRIALLDGNLSPASSNGEDGIEINAAIKEAHGVSVKTAGISAQHSIPRADIPLIRMTSLQNIIDAVAKL